MDRGVSEITKHESVLLILPGPVVCSGTINPTTRYRIVPFNRTSINERHSPLSPQVCTYLLQICEIFASMLLPSLGDSSCKKQMSIHFETSVYSLDIEFLCSIKKQWRTQTASSQNSGQSMRTASRSCPLLFLLALPVPLRTLTAISVCVSMSRWNNRWHHKNQCRPLLTWNKTFSFW